MCRLAQLVLGPAPVETKHRDPPLVFDARINLAIGEIIGDHFATPIEIDEGSVIAANVLLELYPVAAAGQPFDSGRSSVARHALTAAEFDVVAASEAQLTGELIPVQPPWNIQLVAICGVFVKRRQTLEQR